MFELWVVARYMTSRRAEFFNLVSALAIFGMAMGVATLILVMGVVSGFEAAIQRAVTDVAGEILILKRGDVLDPIAEFFPRLMKVAPEIQSIAPVAHREALVAFRGKISGIALEGLRTGTFENTLRLSNRLRSGAFNLGRGSEEVPPLVVGTALAQKLGVSVGDEVKVVYPKSNPVEKGVGFTPRLQRFRIGGILDFGMYEFDLRYALTSAAAVQRFADIGEAFTTVHLKLKSGSDVRKVGFNLATELGAGYLVRDWMESNHNLLSAIRLERVVIFIVLLFVTVAACFNVASTLFVSVLRRVSDIAVLRTLGSSKRRIERLFVMYGMMIGVIGATLGLALGLGLSFLITHTNLIYVPPEIYHINRLPVDLRFWDVLISIVAALLLCFFSTLAPARRAARLNPVEGLRV